MEEIAEATASVTGGDTLIVLVLRIVRVTLVIMTLRRRYMHGVRLRITVAEQGSQGRRNAVQRHHGERRREHPLSDPRGNHVDSLAQILSSTQTDSGRVA
jgi:hypothetical protein